MNTIKLVDLKRQYAALRHDILPAIESVLESMQLYLGPQTRAFEQEWAAYTGARYAIGVDNGTDALLLTMRAYDIGPGDEVITPANTFIAVVEAIMATGATPVFVDCDPATYQIDVAATAAAITSHTRAIVPVHLYGFAANIDALSAIARPRGILVIEDASQAQGMHYQGRKAGSLADGAAFSLYYTKNLGAYGEAGIVTTNDTAIAERIQMLRQHGATVQDRYTTRIPGYNSRLDEIQAAILRVKLRHLDMWNARRRDIAMQYDQLLGDIAVTPTPPAKCDPVYYVYVIRVEERARVQRELREQGIETGIHYPVPLHLQPICAHLGYRPGQFPVTEAYAETILSLPMFAELADAEIEHVAKIVRASVCQPSGAIH
jgi:dTDP-4-amino-4,6-dideoxygalactose transaminase